MRLLLIQGQYMVVLSRCLICKPTASIPRFFNLDHAGAEATRLADILCNQVRDRRECTVRYCFDWRFLEFSLRLYYLGEALLGPA